MRREDSVRCHLGFDLAPRLSEKNAQKPFILHSEYQPTGDQPEAIDALVQGVENGLSEQTLLGVTGSGKTYTMAQVIQRVQKPTLVLAHNKTLVSQLYSEFREFFPHNAVEYFVSYFDYYKPESYLPQYDMYIEKNSERGDRPSPPLGDVRAV